MTGSNNIRHRIARPSGFAAGARERWGTDNMKEMLSKITVGFMGIALWGTSICLGETNAPSLQDWVDRADFVQASDLRRVPFKDRTIRLDNWSNVESTKDLQLSAATNRPMVKVMTVVVAEGVEMPPHAQMILFLKNQGNECFLIHWASCTLDNVRLLKQKKEDRGSPNHTSDGIRQPADGSPKPSS